MRFHVLGVPHTVTSLEYVSCAYTQKVVKFCQMMQGRGHTLIHYGHAESDVPCDEHVTVTTNKDFLEAYGGYDWKKTFFKFDTGDATYKAFYKNTIREINKRKQRYDFVLAFWGDGHKPVCDAFPDLICVEPGIGYVSSYFAKYKVFESYAIMHLGLGHEAATYCKVDWYSTIIPNYFDLSQFTFKDKHEKDDYFLFLGRIYEGKGVHIAIQVAEKLGIKLKLAGQGDLSTTMAHMGYTSETLPDCVEEVGFADVETRRELMANAKAAFVPSCYHEPFGGVQIEMLLSGTPTITTDWGAFAENNLHGLTGYRCRTFGDFLEAARRIDRIDNKFCRDWAADNFNMDRVVLMYEKFFTDILNVEKNEGGWYSEYTGIDIYEKFYPGINPPIKE